MRALAIALLGSLPVMLAASLLANFPEARALATTNVSMGDFFFCDASFQNGICETTINQGDTVVWTNNGSSPHTVQECNDTFTTCPPAGGFDSGIANPLITGQTFSHTFSAPGNFEYWCEIHPDQMRGRVNVLAAQQQTPTPAPTATTGAASGSPTTPPTTTTAAGAGTPAASGGPAVAPATGGIPPSGDTPWSWLTAIIGGAVIVSCAATGLSLLRRR